MIIKEQIIRDMEEDWRQVQDKIKQHSGHLQTEVHIPKEFNIQTGPMTCILLDCCSQIYHELTVLDLQQSQTSWLRKLYRRSLYW